MAYLDLSRAVRGVDFLLRQRQGIHEFTDDEACLFRVSLDTASRTVTLSDGTVVREGDPVLQLHLWNEHVPLMTSAGPSAAWATLMKRRVRTSLAAVARYLEQERQLDTVQAIYGAPPFNSRLGAAQMARTGQRFGCEVIASGETLEWRDRIHAVFDSMLLWGLAYAFNPAGLKTKSLLRHRHQLWISRRTLLLRYGSSGRPPDPADRH